MDKHKDFHTPQADVAEVRAEHRAMDQRRRDRALDAHPPAERARGRDLYIPRDFVLQGRREQGARGVDASGRCRGAASGGTSRADRGEPLQVLRYNAGDILPRIVRGEVDGSQRADNGEAEQASR